LPSEGLVEVLNEGANESTMVARVLRHVEDRPVCPRPEDFYEALKYDCAVVVRLHGSSGEDGAIPIDCRYRNGTVEYVHEFRDRGQVTREAFLFDVRCADDVEVCYHADSQFGDGWICYDCGEECFDTESERIQSRNAVGGAGPECGAVDEVPQGSESPREPCGDGLVTDGGFGKYDTDTERGCDD